MEWIITKDDHGAIERCARELLATVSPMPAGATVLALVGDLGAGKTTLVQAIAAELGITEIVISPTFTIMKRYQTDHQYESLVHIDAYRFDDEAESVPLHLSDLLAEPNTLVCIEWPERVASFLPPTAQRLTITIEADEARRVELASWAA